MESTRLPPTVGVLACLAFVVVVLVPYLVVPSAEAAAVGAYYDAPLVGPPILALFAGVGFFAFAGGRQERTDPLTAAGAALAVGVFTFALAALWAVTADVEAIQATTSGATWLAEHRWAVVAAAAVIPACAGWYALELDVF